jgi:4-amino-4-deoxy-L-arabinose transferase-like glycosyltransferase
MSSQEVEEVVVEEKPNPFIEVIARYPYLWLFVISLIIRVGVGFTISHPGYVDAYYYYQVAENWKNGFGWSDNTLWNYQLTSFRPATPPPNLTHTALDYWNPLTAWLAALSFSIFGVSFWAAQIPFILCSAALPPLAFYVGRLMFGRNQLRYSLTMAIVCMFAGRYFVYWNTTDNFAPFALIGILALICIQKGIYQNDFWLIPAGVLSGLAYLSRNDGILIYVTLVICFLWVRFRGSSLVQLALPRWWMLIASGLAALLTVTPWLIRNWLELGYLLAPYSAKVLYLRQYEELFSYSLTLDLNHYLSWGIGNIITTKINALWINLLLICTQGLFALAPLFVIGFILLFRKPLFLPFLTYTFVLYFAMSLIFTEISVRGTLFHSAGVLLPFQAGAVVLGCEWLAKLLLKRNSSLDYEARQRRIMSLGSAIASVVLLISVSLTLFFAYNEIQIWDEPVTNARELYGLLEQNKLTNVVVIVNEPTGYYYTTRQQAMGQAFDGVEANLRAAKQYGAKYLVLTKSHYPSMSALYRNKTAPGVNGLKFNLVVEYKDYQIYEILADGN